MSKILLLAAVWQEVDYLLTILEQKWNHENIYIQHQQRQIIVQVTGVGAINAALTTTRLLATDTSIDEVWMIGCCGSYHESINIGDVIIATQEINSDIGIMSESVWQSPSHFPFAILEKNGQRFYNVFPCKIPEQNSTQGSYQVHFGNLLTTSTVSGCSQYAKLLAKRHLALAENMEGAAVAHVATFFDKPFVEIRGVSNIAGERDKTKWDFSTAFKNSNDVCLQIWLGNK